MEHLEEKYPILKEMQKGKEVVWINPGQVSFAEGGKDLELTEEDIRDASARLKRFAPFIVKCFPETADRGGLIESALTEIPAMREQINRKYGSHLEGRLLLKQDSHLAIAGSVKARGGIYEVLKHTEELALSQGMLSLEEDYSCLANPRFRKFFEQYTVQVGSTGNLGMSIGIASAAIGYRVLVHMSADARQWKKDLLRSKGVTVLEYESDYSGAVEKGKEMSRQDPKSYFVDDENSRDLFLGYAVVAERLAGQLREKEIQVDEKHPLFVYIPCGVGGAPGGITFGLKHQFGDFVHCFFMEPTQAPCMLTGMVTGLHGQICVQDIGLSGRTHADGLAVGRPSGFVGKVMEPMLGGTFTVEDANLYEYMRDLLEAEDLFLEPSACASFQGVIRGGKSREFCRYLEEHGLENQMENAVHIAWATGGSLVPQEVRETYKNTYLDR